MRKSFVAILLLVAACGRTGFDGAEGTTATPAPTPSPGRLDPGFGTQGVSRTPLTGIQVLAAATSAGKILVAGTAENDWVVVRFHANGLLDATFATSGILRVDETGTGTLSDFAVLPDGRFLLAGMWDDDGTRTVAIRRFLADGTPDESFTIDRPLPWDVPVGRAIAIALAPNGDVLFTRSRDESSNTTRFFVERVDSSGAYVVTFSGDGVAQVDIQDNDGAWPVGIATDASNRIIVAGVIDRSSQHDLFVSRFHADGTPDLSWDGDGTADIADGDDDRVAVLAVHPDGRVTLGGATQTSTLLCATFSGTGAFEGRATITGSRPGDGVFAARVQSDGALVLAGARDDRFMAARVLADGTTDSSLGVLLPAPLPAAGRAIVPDGAAYLFAGDAADEIVLARWIP